MIFFAKTRVTVTVIVLTLATLFDAILIVILSNDILMRVILLNELMLKVRVLGCPTLLSVTLPNGVRTNAVVPFPDCRVCVFFSRRICTEPTRSICPSMTPESPTASSSRTATLWVRCPVVLSHPGPVLQNFLRL